MGHPDLRDTLRLLRHETASVRLAGVFMSDAIWRRYGAARLPLREIAQGTGLCLMSSQRAVARLMTLKFIERTHGGGRSNGGVYRLLN